MFLQFGKIILTTSVGIMDHEEARRKKMGGKVSECGILQLYVILKAVFPHHVVARYCTSLIACTFLCTAISYMCVIVCDCRC